MSDKYKRIEIMCIVTFYSIIFNEKVGMEVGLGILKGERMIRGGKY